MSFNLKWLGVDRNYDLEQNTLGSDSLMENVKRQKQVKARQLNPQEILAGKCIQINLSIFLPDKNMINENDGV